MCEWDPTLQEIEHLSEIVLKFLREIRNGQRFGVLDKVVDPHLAILAGPSLFDYVSIGWAPHVELRMQLSKTRRSAVK